MPKRPMTEAQAAKWNERVLAERRSQSQQGRRRQDPGPEPYDQFWTLRKSWTGEEYFTPGTERNEFVRHQYDPLRALDD
jgi:hypothetical protein